MTITRMHPIITKLTEEEAVNFQKIETLKRLERKLSKSRTKGLRNAVLENRYIPFLWYRAYVGKGKKIHRINGNHTSALFANEPLLIKNDMVIVYWDVYCDTEEEASSLYIGIDSRMSARSLLDSYRAAVKADPKLQHIDDVILQSVITAITAAEHSYNFSKNSSIPVLERARYTQDPIYRDFVLLIDRIVAGNRKRAKVFLTGPILGGVYMLYSHGVKEHDLFDFLVTVRDASHPNPGHPTRRLRSWLKQRKSNTSGSMSQEADKKRKRTVPGLFMKAVVEAWNRTCENDLTPVTLGKNSRIKHNQIIETIVRKPQKLK